MAYPQFSNFYDQNHFVVSLQNIIAFTNDDINNDIGWIYGVLNGNIRGQIMGSITGFINGNIYGNVYGDVSGHIFGSVFGNIIGSVSGVIMGDVEGTVQGRVTGHINGTVGVDDYTPAETQLAASASPSTSPSLTVSANTQANKSTIGKAASSGNVNGVIQGRIQKCTKTPPKIRIPGLFNRSIASNLCNKTTEKSTIPLGNSSISGDIFIANLWNYEDDNRIEEAILTFEQEGDLFNNQVLNSSLDALSETFLPRTQELREKILLRIQSKNVSIVLLSFDTDLNDNSDENILPGAESSKKIESSEKICCPVCWDNIDELKFKNKTTMSTKCGHIICKECIDTLFKKKAKIECPSCRTNVTKKQIHVLYI
jgi:hypothetical protein